MFCSKVNSKFRELWAKVDALILKNLPLISTVMNNLKLSLSSPLIVGLTDLTESNWDNILREKIVAALDKSLKEIALVKSALNVDGTINVKVLVALLADLPKADRDSFFFKASALMLKYLHFEKYPQSDYDFFTQANYSLGKLE